MNAVSSTAPNASRRVVSSSSALLESEYSHPTSSDPGSPSPAGGEVPINSRRVLADITWWFDGQFCSMEDGSGFDELDSTGFNLAENVIGLSGSTEGALGMGLTEDAVAPETFTMDYNPPSPASSTSSTSSKLLTVLEESDGIPWPSIPSFPDLRSLKNRRESSFSSVSDLDFEDVVPCPAYV